ncbi:hypothetical protein J3R82DRAFT_2121 [Butyriboletus roseoflavus]|nr:hypothetical protein J3R82DRAFT_2121 [Butyriboletus roseoflavus]
MAIKRQNDPICTLGWKFSMTHCFWVNPGIFSLMMNPNVDLNCAECWLSPLSTEDTMKTELYQFVPSDLHPLMAHKTFRNLTIHSESVSDVKGSARSIFGLNAKFFIRGYSWFDKPRCQELLLDANAKYTKFTPVLFPDPNNLCKDLFLKTASLAVQKILKVMLFGKSSLSGQNTSGPRPKGQIWELWSTTAGMIAAAGILVHSQLLTIPLFQLTNEFKGNLHSFWGSKLLPNWQEDRHTV